MRVLKVVAVLLLLVLAIGWYLPSDYKVERAIVIKAPPERIYALVATPRRWKEWSVWTRRDPAMALQYFGPETGQGAGWSWDSRTEGKGRMTLKQSDPATGFSYELYFPDFDSTSTGDFRLQVVPEGTRVTWNNLGDFGPNPLKHYMALLMDRMAGPDFAAGLSNLKTLSEQR